MENKIINDEDLKVISGGQSDSFSFCLGEQVSIDSGNPKCPNCGESLGFVKSYPSQGFDVFLCSCGHYYAHVYAGDLWYRSYPSF